MPHTFTSRLASFRTRHLALLADDLSESSRSVIVAPAQIVTADLFNQALTLAKSVPFVALSPQRASAFVLQSMARPRTSQTERRPLHRLLGTVEAREGIGSGISAADRASTIAILGEAEPSARKLVRPGHIFPLETRPGGTLVSATLPEGALDLSTLAGFTDAALTMDLLNDRGELCSNSEVEAIANASSLPLIRLSEIITARLQSESLIARVAEADLPTRYAGTVRAILYRSELHHTEHVALVKGPLDFSQPVLVRVQPELLVHDVLGGLQHGSRAALLGCFRAINQRGSGIVIYLRRPPSESMSSPRSPRNMMAREYGLGAQILRDLGVRRIELLSASSRSLEGLSLYGIEITKYLPVTEFFDRAAPHE
jgi:3,4-dihydroxy 2-butanone 4-phosphate synthase / GTP cyclohydrolase II